MVNNRQSRVTIGVDIDSQSITNGTKALDGLAISVKGVKGASTGFSADILALNPELAALAGQASNAAAATQTLAKTQVLAANAANQNTTAMGAQRAGVQDLSALYAGLDANVKHVIRDIGDLGRAPIPEPSLSSIVPGLSNLGGGASTGIRSARNAAISLPGVGFQSPIVVGLRGLELVADKTGASLAQMGAAVGVVGVFAAGAFLALEAFNKGLEDSRKRLVAALQAQDTYYKALATNTNEQTDAQIAELQKTRPLLEQQLQETRNAIISAFGEDTLTDEFGIGRFQRGLAKLVSPDLFTQLDKQQAALDANIDAETRLTQGREAGAFAANTSAEVEDKLREARQKAAQQATQELLKNINTTTATNLRLAEIRRSGSSDQISSLIDSNSDRERLLRNFEIPALVGQTSEAAKTQLEAFRDELNELIRTDELLLNVVKPIVVARENEAAAIHTQLEIIDDSIAYRQKLDEQIRTSTVDQVTDRLHGLQEEAAAIRAYLPQLQELAPTSKEAAKALADAETHLSQTTEAYADQITRVLPAAIARAQTDLAADQEKIRADSQRKLEQIEADRADKDAAARTTRDEANADSERKRGDALNDLAEKQAAEREKIERKANEGIKSAIYARDALAAFKLQAQKQQDLQDLTERGTERAGEIDKQARRERAQADRNFDKALRNAQDAADKAARLERDRAGRELNERINAYNKQIALLDLFNTQGTAQIASFVNNALNTLRSLAQGVGPALSGASGGIGAGTGVIPGGIGGGIGMPPGWVPFPPVTGTAAGGGYLANRASFPAGLGLPANLNVSGALPTRGMSPGRAMPTPSIYSAPRPVASGGGNSYTFQISGSKADARAIAKQIEPLIRATTRDEVVEVARALEGRRS